MFFNPVVVGGAAAGLGISVVVSPLKTLKAGLFGAMNGALGVTVIGALGYSTCTVGLAAAVGAVSAMCIATPLALALAAAGLLTTDEISTGSTFAHMAIEVGVLYLASFLLAASLFLGALPATAVGVGAAITTLTIEAVFS